MRRAAVILLLATMSNVKAQYGIDGTVAAAGHYAFWEIEKKDLNDIMASQQQIFAVNVASALEQAKLLDISKARYHSLSNVDDGIENAKTLAQIALEADRLYELDRSITELIAPYPIVQAAISPALTELLIEQAILLADTAISTVEGPKNLMNSKGRFAIMARVLGEVKRINGLAMEIHAQARTLISLLNIEELNIGEAPTYDINQAIEETRGVIENLIREP